MITSAKMNKILITTSSFAKESKRAIELMEGMALVFNPYGRTLREDELVSLLDEHKPIGLLAGTEKIDRGTLEKAMAHLVVISRVGVGWDNVDRASAKELGIRLFRTEGVLTQSVAELTLGLILAALRRIPAHDRALRQNQWKKQMGGLLAGKKVGLVGFGDIGMRVGALVKAFGATVMYNDMVPRETEEWAESTTLDTLLRRSDIVSLHASGNTLILGECELDACKPGVVIVNTARGSLIDEDALYRYLVKGHIGYACLDVFAEEPYSGSLKDLENVIMSPHVGSYAREARIQMEERAVLNMLSGLKECGML